MQSLKVFTLAVAGAAMLAGCGANPVTTYRIAVDESALTSLPSTCYRNGTTPAQRDTNPNEHPEYPDYLQTSPR